MKLRKSTGVEVERRAVALAAAGVEGRNFTGNAAVFNVRTAIGNPLQWGFFEQVAPGAFDRSISGGDVVQLADHDPGKPLARMSAGTLRLSADQAGLAVDSDLVETSYADDLIANVRAGNVRGQSFGFQTVRDDWQTEQIETNDGASADVEVRTLLEVKLIEVSAVTFPAYPTTTADVRDAFASRQARVDPDVIAELGAYVAEMTEARVGAVLSAANKATLQKVCDMINELMAGNTPPPAEKDDAFPLDLAIRHRQVAERWGLILT